MTIGINAAAAIKQPRTGVEEYVYQLVKYLTMLPEARRHRFFLYIPEGGAGLFDFPLPPNFEIKVLRWPLPFLWTQVRLAWELWRRQPEALFIPAHVLPPGSPKNSVVAIHGLEYEYFPEYYSPLRRWYLRWSTKRAVKRAGGLIAVSDNTKKDLVKLYGCQKEKIEVVYHGAGISINSVISARSDSPETRREPGMTTGDNPYLLYLGRVETKKNVQGILEAYKILKEEYKVPHELVLAGARGFGYEILKLKIKNCKLRIKELGYIDDVAKWQLLRGADVFLFPSFYEGFGLPVLEAQSAGVPVVTSANSCLPEVAGEGALFVNPKNPAQIAEAAKLIIDDSDLRDRLRQSGFENIKRFSWEKCARETLKIVTRV